MCPVNVLNASKDRNPTACLSACFSVCPPSWYNRKIPVSNLDLPCSSLWPLSHVHSLCSFKKNPTPSTLCPLIRQLQTAVRFPFHLLFFCGTENFSQPLCIRPVLQPPAIPVGLCWTCSNTSTPFLCRQALNCIEHSRFGLTSDK